MIRFYCDCGKRLKVRAENAGRTAKCPYCGVRVHVPEETGKNVGAAEALAAAVGGTESPATPSAPVAEVAPAKPPRRHPTPPKPKAQVRPRAAQPSPQPAAREDHAAAGLAALARAVGEDKAKTPKKTGDPMARVRNQMSAKDGPASLQVLSRRHGAKPNNTKAVMVGVGVAVVVLGGAIALAFLGGGGKDSSPASPPPPEVRVSRPAGSPGELFPNVAPKE